MDYRYELDFAGEQLEHLRTAVGEFLKTDPYVLIGQQQMNGATSKYALRAQVRAEAPPRIRSLIGATPSHPDRIEFPIFFSDKAYRDKSRGAQWKIGEASTTVQTAIERLQPFHASDAAYHPLWLIHELRRRHIHRKHLTTGAIAGIAALRIRQGAIISLKAGRATLGAFQNGAVIMEWEVMPMPPVEMEFQVGFDVAFAKEGPARGAPLIEKLGELRNHVRDAIFPALEPLL